MGAVNLRSIPATCDNHTMNETTVQTLHATVPEELAGRRLDQALAALFPQYSRSRLKGWILAGLVKVNDTPQLRPRECLAGGEEIELQARVEPEQEHRPEAIDLAVVHEDEQLVVIDKPAGLVVHPGAGNPAGTLLNALLHHAPELEALPRCGIVHRLDKETSGLLVVARTLEAHTALVRQLQARTVHREYRAVVNGLLVAGGTVDAPVGRHPVQRTRMAILERGRSAVTHYRVLERYRRHTLLRLLLETGRTHQIRVHMAHIRHPLVGDPVYGARPLLPPQPGPELARLLQGFSRQALHACALELRHPASTEPMRWESPLPEDMARLIALLEEDRERHPEPS